GSFSSEPEPLIFETEAPSLGPESSLDEAENLMFEPEPPTPEVEPMMSEPEAPEQEPDTQYSEPELTLPEKPVYPEPVVNDEPLTDEASLEPPSLGPRLRKPAYLDDEDVNPIQGVTVCPHCKEKVPATIYCINCGKSLEG
ncbi:hypothetical protein JXL21_11870, partial [Candidatus Bathyarchaeota archaeon]|nr:hypothetical protein [Candidatus Bathyarchaeota archaeon]